MIISIVFFVTWVGGGELSLRKKYIIGKKKKGSRKNLITT